MKSRGHLLIGFAIALGVAGCKSSSSSSVDAAPTAPDAARSDLGPDTAAVTKNDTAALPDEPALPDTGGPEAAPDLRPADVLLADTSTAPEAPAADRPLAEAAAAEAPAADRTAIEVSATERPGADAATDGARPDVVASDATAGDLGGDAGCTGWTTLQRLSPADAKTLIETSDVIVINVHIPYAGDIPGTDVDIPYNNVDAIEAYLNYDHCADVLLVCKSGGMSQSAGNELIKRGYLRVRDLNGGMDAWQAAGYPLLMDGGV